MLAGCPSTLPSPRHKLRIEASVRLQACHFQLQEKHCPPQNKMGTQRLDLPCGFSSRKDPLRVALLVEKPSAEARGTSCSFRQNPATQSSSSGIVVQTPSWGGTVEISEGRSGPWEQRRNLKRFHERSSCNYYRAKRTRTNDVAALVDLNDIVWPQSTGESPLAEEEEKDFLVRSAASFPRPTSSSHTLVGYFGPEDDLSTDEDPNEKSQSDSSSSSGAYICSSVLTKDSSGNMTSNGSQIPCSSGVADVGVEGKDSQMEQQGIVVVCWLTSCAESISSGKYEAMNFSLDRLGEMATPLGTPIHRLAAYFTEALALRVAKLLPHIFSVASPKSIIDLTEDDNGIALRLLDCVSPILKFLHFTLNMRLLKAFEGKDRLHIMDFDVKQRFQWPSLFQSLASMPNPPSHVRITGVGESRQDLQDTGVRLAKLAELLNLPFEFHPVVDRLEDIRLWMLHVKREECIAVNCVLMMHKALYDETGKVFMDLLSLIRSTHPEIVVMAEQEAQHNEPNWETRLARSLNYYAAIFDSLDYVLPMDSQARIKVEEAFAKEIRNIVAYEGSERTESLDGGNLWRMVGLDA